MKITRRGLFGMLTAIPLAVLAPFRSWIEPRTLAWKVEFKSVILSPQWMCKLDVKPPEGFIPSPEEARKAHLKLICRILEVEKKFMEPHTVKL